MLTNFISLNFSEEFSFVGLISVIVTYYNVWSELLNENTKITTYTVLNISVFNFLKI